MEQTVTTVTTATGGKQRDGRDDSAGQALADRPRSRLAHLSGRPHGGSAHPQILLTWRTCRGCLTSWHAAPQRLLLAFPRGVDSVRHRVGRRDWRVPARRGAENFTTWEEADEASLCVSGAS